MWKAKSKKDQALEGKPNPEGNPKRETLSSLGETKTLEAKAHPTIAQVLAEDNHDIGEWKLSQHEIAAEKDLSKMSDAEMPDRYKLPLVELSTAIKAGAARRSKSIVQILMDIMKETRTELFVTKAKFTKRLNLDYDTSWNLKRTLNNQ